MQLYDDEWAANYEFLANAGIPGREGLYRLCRTTLMSLPQEASILIVGCGTGADLIPLVDHFPDYRFTAIEPAEGMFNFCSNKLQERQLAHRVELHQCTLDDFETQHTYDAATSILVSQHLTEPEEAQVFFTKLQQLLKPGGWLYTADIHIAGQQDRQQMLDMWQQQALMAGTPAELVVGLLENFRTNLRPRDEYEILDFLQRAGFTNIIKVFSSLIYGAWCGQKIS